MEGKPLFGVIARFGHKKRPPTNDDYPFRINRLSAASHVIVLVKLTELPLRFR